MVSDRTPIIVGVGQFVERLDQPDYRGLSPADLAAEAVRAAAVDCTSEGVLANIDALGAIRTFEDSTPRPTPFGKPDKFPLAIAKRLNIAPAIAILEKAGGQLPATLIADLADRIAAGAIDAAVALGSEAISTTRHLTGRGEARDWRETLEGAVEDHGAGLAGIVKRYHMMHGITGAPAGYALLENARRARLGLSREAYAQEMGRLFAPFTAIAANNPYASSVVSAATVEELVGVTERNRMVADPYTVKLVSRDQVNQAAAVILMSVARARELGIPQDKWIFLHGCAATTERDIIERVDIGASPAAKAALEAALHRAGKHIDEIAHLDFYSCFPIAVFAAATDSLGLAPDDPRQLTVTGGLPFFGGPGNNYSMHAIATMSSRLRNDPGAFGLIGANGGYISKYAGLVLSTEPAEWLGCECADLQEELDEAPVPKIAVEPAGWGDVLTYTIVYSKGAPVRAIVIGELDAGGRFMANEADPVTLARMIAEDPLGQRIYVHATADGNRFAFDRETIRRVFPRVKPAFRNTYENVLVERRGRVLEVTINRPDARNALNNIANRELESIFDAFEADGDLWVAIITGAGDKAFCAGMDLKGVTAGSASARTGFAGLTNRPGRTKPIIAAINGIAFGGGTETALACDLVVADPGAKFGLTEVRVGVIAGAGGALRLPRQIPRKVAVELLLTGRHMAAQEAHSYGLVNRISASGEAMTEARRLADEIVAVSPTSVRLTMQIMHESDAYSDPDEAAAAMLRSSAIDELMVSADMMEGMAAFAQKRPPVWKNR